MAPGSDARGILTPFISIAVAMSQGDPLGLMLLHGVLEEDLQRERQQLARVRLPFLHGPGCLSPQCARGGGQL